MFLKRRHSGLGIPPQAGEGPKSAATGVMDDGGSVASGICRLTAGRGHGCAVTSLEVRFRRVKQKGEEEVSA